MKDTAMLITVGTGIGGDDRACESLAHGILYSIENYNPKKVVFFGSKLSGKTINSIKKQYFDEYGEEFDFYEFVEINEIDSFNSYFTEIKSKLLELEDDYRIIIDYTSGTKTMTMSAAFISMIFHKKLVFVSGDRVNGVVQKGTEEINSQNLYLIYDDLIISKIKDLFNSNRFEAGKVLIDDITNSNENKKLYTKLFDSYCAFDNVNYKVALDNFDIKEFSSKWPDLEKQFRLNIKALNILNNKSHGLRCYYILASMLNNSRRRSLESKYDDAIARLYRCLELIAQIKLNSYGINTSNVDTSSLKGKVSDEFLKKLEYYHDGKSNKIRIGLIQDYKLLNELGDELGEYYVKNEKLIQNVIKYRNSSILAHGLDFQNKNQYDEFRDVVLDASKVLNENIEDFINETVFPEF